MSQKIKHRKNTQSLIGHKDKEEYLVRHLFYELHWLLAAASEWSIQDQLNLGIGGYQVQVYAMDSAFVHARTLFEFFLKRTSKNYYGVDQFLGHGVVLTSASYTNGWDGPLHSHVMHAQDRSSPAPLISSGVAKPLNEMPVDFAHAILGLWKDFEVRLGQSNNTQDQELGKLARDKRRDAIASAACVVSSAVAKRHSEEKSKLLQSVFTFS